jgi:hypothetical protein
MLLVSRFFVGYLSVIYRESIGLDGRMADELERIWKDVIMA